MVVDSSETAGFIYQITLRHNPQENNTHSRNPQTHNFKIFPLGK
jgi:hypothetical protein